MLRLMYYNQVLQITFGDRLTILCKHRSEISELKNLFNAVSLFARFFSDSDSVQREFSVCPRITGDDSDENE